MNADTDPLLNVIPVRSKRPTRALLYLILVGLDAAAIVLAQAIAGVVHHNEATVLGWQLGLIVLPFFLAFAVSTDLYTSKVFRSLRSTLPAALYALFLATVAITFVAYFIKFGDQISRIGFVVGTVVSAIGLICNRIVFVALWRHYLQDQPFNELVLCDGQELRLPPSARHVLDAARLRLKPDLSDPTAPQRFGYLTAGYDRVIVACPPAQRTAWTLLLRASNVQGEIFVPEVDSTGVLGINHFEGHYTHVIAKGPLSLSNRFRKRALDLALVVPTIIALAPLLAVIALAIKLDSKGPVLFRQDRVGRNNQLFKINKFRSMRVETSDQSGNRSASRDDDRITRVGHFIRKTSIDELPQVFNVLLGDMSLVGPRPHALGSRAGDQLFWQISPEYWVRHALKPGITGLAQVRGFRGATHHRTDLENRLKADIEYLENWSLLREIEILLRTFLVITHRNAY